jgi:hypothetical protein
VLNLEKVTAARRAKKKKKPYENKLAEAVTLLKCGWQISSSNLGQGTDYPDRGFSWFS